MTILSREIKLDTFLDEYAAELSISRKISEDVSSFNDRVIVAHENLYQSGPEAFLRSLDYITTERTKRLCNITFTDEIDLRDVEVVGDKEKLSLNIDGAAHVLPYKDYKFVGLLLEKLQEVPGILLENLNDSEELFFKKSCNILPVNNRRQFLSFESSEKIIKLPVTNVVRVLNQRDMGTTLPFNNTEGTEILNEDGGVLKMLIEYKGFPVRLDWSVFNITACNSEYFKSLLKDENGFLTSSGAKLINEILKKQNTYWGK